MAFLLRTSGTPAQLPRRRANRQAIGRDLTKLKGAFIIDLERRMDERGFFACVVCQQEFQELGLKPVIAQASIASSPRAGTAACIVQLASDTKLVRCTGGALLDIIVWTLSST
jgi:dTDP-4-dehydrorhamnose 3,5-epimerase-like enzyme